VTVPDPTELTLAAYRAAAEEYVAGSSRPGEDLRAHLDRFADLVGGGPVLEVGTGPGWDADHLQERGVLVLRSDGAPEFVQRARDAGHEARVIDVRHDALGGPYRGVLADAVLLHLPADQFEGVLRRLADAVEPGGFLGLTLKEGDGHEWTTEKIEQPRFFQYWREPALRTALAVTGWEVIRLDRARGRSVPWLHVLAQRRPSDA
jgi:SAM-dependent methyltransferase